MELMDSILAFLFSHTQSLRQNVWNRTVSFNDVKLLMGDVNVKGMNGWYANCLTLEIGIASHLAPQSIEPI